MKVVILAGGFGTRLSEETHLKPKPMVEIGDRPIIWHIMKIFSSYNINEFIICCGYKGYLIKEYFANYALHSSDVTFDITSNTIEVHKKKVEPWKITLVDTGPVTMTGGRLKRIKDFLNNGPFFMTYGDGVGNININKLLEFHKKNNKKATLTAVKPPSRFGNLGINDDNLVTKFKEKPVGEKSWINGGFFVLEPQIFDYISGDDCIWEKEPLEKLSSENELGAYKHNDFWQPMDNIRDLKLLNDLWNSDSPPWKIW
tara:strand:- start:967 stop:1737 length:771 start_codon:yes stop_codon:yes gene_type:complete